MKRNISFVGVLFFVILLCGVTINAENEDAELQKTFAEAIEAVGGQKEISKIKSIEVFADCNGPEGKYTTEINSFRSNKTHFKQTFTYRDEITNVFINDKLAWKKSVETGEFSLVSPFQTLVIHLHEYQKMAFDFQMMFTDFELVGDEIFEQIPSVKVSAKNQLGGKIYLFFDKETKLLAGYILPIPNSNESVKNVFNEWKKIGKVKLPSVVTATDNLGDWVLRFNKITVNKSEEGFLDVPPRVNDLAELMRLQKQSETAHLTYDAELLIEAFHDNGITEINRGEVSNLTKEAGLKRFKSYFSSVKFLEWADIKPPVIAISKDGTLATIILQKRVRSIPKNDTTEKNLRHYEFAWMETWKKFEGKWKLTTVISTDKEIGTENNSPQASDNEELLKLHKQHQTAHLTYDAELFVETFADNLVTVQRGEVITRNKAENLKRIKGYFASYKFDEWEDVKPPVIKISKDGTLATIIVEKLVKGTYKNEKGEKINDLTEFAWLEVWKKIHGKWKITTVASTRKENDDKK